MRSDEGLARGAILRIGSMDIRYYVREPSPDHWNAIGVIERHDRADGRDEVIGHQMLVGIGSSEDEAIGHLITRVLSGHKGGPLLPPGSLKSSTTEQSNLRHN
jgi:hypothetical protein